MMVVLYIYLGSIALTVAVDKFYDKAYEKELEIKGYEYKKSPSNVYKNIRTRIIEFLFQCLPLINLIYDFYVFSQFNKLLDEEFENDLENDYIQEIKIEEPVKLVETAEIDKDLVEGSKIVIYKVENHEKKEMTREEKLEFLREEYQRLTGDSFRENDTNSKIFGIGKRRS